jgi:hypothetical protein
LEVPNGSPERRNSNLHLEQIDENYDGEDAATRR